MSQKMQNAKQLVDEFKKSGEFDRLRKQLLIHFMNSDEKDPLMSKAEAIVQEKLSTDVRLEHKRVDQVYSEVIQELERYPMIGDAITSTGVLKDEALLTSIEQYARNILNSESNHDTKLWEAQPPRPKPQEKKAANDNDSDEEMLDGELRVSNIDEEMNGEQKQVTGADASKTSSLTPLDGPSGVHSNGVEEHNPPSLSPVTRPVGANIPLVSVQTEELQDTVPHAMSTVIPKEQQADAGLESSKEGKATVKNEQSSTPMDVDEPRSRPTTPRRASPGPPLKSEQMDASS
ncbi:hypothetical protein M422DRAFT_265858 [Sphaerobolus stellatus SS14]|uniref:BOD1/SHG1 domain-containing protein n=1 Tax=Sphaerobolus stellatus (strain SS14) TaxID=990650 RepID=A0A0C9UCH3_SPHS4|nr:hypothetical protein M422DRAFT_265858 [Sphaerobolus stellatus SS14]